MPRQQGTSVQNKFIRGYVTDTTALAFPEDACTEVNNVVFDSLGRVTRRLGFDTEANYTADSISLSSGDAYTSFVWKAVSGDGNKSYLVVQSGSNIQFYDISTSIEISTNKHPTEIDLDSYIVSESNKDPANSLCQFSSGNGDLFIVNAACNPLYVSYSIVEDSFTVGEINIQIRDFAGLNDGLEVDERPTASVGGIETSNPEHLYNLYNQGWAGTDALSQWDTARSDLPSNADYIGLYRDGVDDAFNPTHVTAQDAGNRPAPTGHFILNAFAIDRNQALSDAGFSFSVEDTAVSLIDPSEGSVYTDFGTNPSNAFDGILRQTNSFLGSIATATSVSSAYMGKDFGAGNLKTVSRVVLYPDAIFIFGSLNGDGFLENDNFNCTITLYGNTSTPSNATDGTNLGSGTLTSDQLTTFTIDSNDTTTEYRYIWVNIVPNSTDTIYISEMQIFSSGFSFERPTCTAFYAGRVFYGGVTADDLSNNIYFSQIVENENQYGLCHQKNDPVNENFSDLLPDDGGVIKIPEMGTLEKLYTFQNALFAFASNGVWLIQGVAGNIFQADGYQVKRISDIGITSPDSLVSIRGLPAWWAEDGIYTVQFDPNYDSFTPTSLTDDIIEIYYRSIPESNKMYVKGAYDTVEQIVYWLYNSDDDLSSDVYRYNTVLCMDTKSKAFYTWEISEGPIVRTIDYIVPADRSTQSLIKYMIHQDYNGSTADQTFAEVSNENYLDWENEGTEVDYTSYFITGYKLDGETQKFFQPNYIFVFLEQETNASCLVQGIFDYTSSANTGKWSTLQQIYNANLLNRNVNFRRLKMRGKGRALQLRFESESQKPFTIIGWSIWETSNAGL